MSTAGPIETRYKGYRFRSRLEARWAVFLDSVGAQWEYEKEGYRLPGDLLYLPDFWLPNVGLRTTRETGIWLEVKPGVPTEIEELKCRLLGELTGKPVVVMMGAPVAREGEWGYQIYPGWDNCMFFGKCHKCGAMKIEFLEGNYMECEVCGGRCDDDHVDVLAACRAARSARFEYGEDGTSGNG